MHPFLNRNENGRVVIRWSRLVPCLAVAILASLAVTVAFQYFMGIRFRVRVFAISTMFTIVPWLVLLYVAKRQAEGKSARQFSLAALLAGITVVCLFFALTGSERRADSEELAQREQHEKALMAIVGTGTVHVSGQTFVQIKRTSFSDDDLEKIIRFKTQLDDVGSPLYFLDLSGTNVSDRGIARLATMKSLEYLFLERTAVTDASIDSIEALPHIRVMSAMSTVVTPERLLKLSIKQPKWDINPKTYQRLKTR